MADIKTMFSGYVQRTVRNALDGQTRTVTYDVMARWDVDEESGLIIGSQTPVDASGCQVKVNITFTPPA